MIVIDPYLLALPTGPGVGAEAVLEYARRFSSWEKEFSASKCFITSQWASDMVYNLQLAPTVDNLRALFARFHITEYSPLDIAPAANGVLANAPRVEELAGLDGSDLLEQIECLRDTEVVIPEEIRARLAPQVADEFIESLIYAGYARQVRQDKDVWSIATAPLDEEQTRETMLLQCAIEKLADDLSIERTSFSQEWPLLFDPEHLYATYDVLDFYRSDPHMATRVAWCQMKANGIGLRGIGRAHFTFGTRFRVC